jgi:hypothetical protein
VGLTVVNVGARDGRGVVGALLGPIDGGGVGGVGLLVGLHVCPSSVGPIEGADVLVVGVCVGALVASVGDFEGDEVGLV